MRGLRSRQRARIAFCWLPPLRRPMASSGEEVLTFRRASDWRMHCCSAASSRLLSAPEKRSSAASVMFFPTAMTGTMPSFLRSSGTIAMPWAIACWQLSIFTGWPSIKIVPSQRPGHTPNRHCTASVRPAPTNPAIPRISPLCRENETLLTRLMWRLTGCHAVRFSTRSTSSPLV